MPDNPHLPALVAAYRRWAETKGANVEEILDMFADEIEMLSVLTDDVPDEISGRHVNRDGARAYFTGLLRDWEMLSYSCDRFVADGDDIVMIGRCAWRNRATGLEVDSPKIDVHSFNHAGKVFRFQEVFDTLGFARALGMV